MNTYIYKIEYLYKDSETSSVIVIHSTSKLEALITFINLSEGWIYKIMAITTIS